MATGLRYERLADGRIFRYYEAGTNETVHVRAPVSYYEDFMGADVVIPATGSDESGCEWTKSASTGTVAKGAGAANGTIACTITNADSDQKAILCMDNQFCFNVGALGVTKYAQAEFKLSIVHTASDTLAGIHFLAGMGQTVTADVSGTNFFDAGMTVLAGVEASAGVATASDVANTSLWLCADDTAVDNAVDSGIDLAESTDYIVRIDFTTLADVKFYVNGTRYGSGTTFDMSTLTAAEAVLQPYFGAYKHTTEGDVGGAVASLDYFRFWGIR